MVYDHIKSHDHNFAMISENNQTPVAEIKKKQCFL